jgi:hypothetical protein
MKDPAASSRVSGQTNKISTGQARGMKPKFWVQIISHRELALPMSMIL